MKHEPYQIATSTNVDGLLGDQSQGGFLGMPGPPLVECVVRQYFFVADSWRIELGDMFPRLKQEPPKTHDAISQHLLPCTLYCGSIFPDFPIHPLDHDRSRSSTLRYFLPPIDSVSAPKCPLEKGIGQHRRLKEGIPYQVYCRGSMRSAYCFFFTNIGWDKGPSASYIASVAHPSRVSLFVYPCGHPPLKG